MRVLPCRMARPRLARPGTLYGAKALLRGKLKAKFKVIR